MKWFSAQTNQALVEDFPNELEKWKLVVESPNPHREILPYPPGAAHGLNEEQEDGQTPPEGGLTGLQKLCVLRAVRSDKIVAATLDYVAGKNRMKLIAKVIKFRLMKEWIMLKVAFQITCVIF